MRLGEYGGFGNSSTARLSGPLELATHAVSQIVEEQSSARRSELRRFRSGEMMTVALGKAKKKRLRSADEGRIL